MRAAFPTRRLSSASFAEAMAASLFVLVRVEPGLTSLHPGVARFFDRQYPGLFGFGTLSVRDTRGAGWWERNFRTAAGAVRVGTTGYWLFHEALVVGHHTGIVRADLTYTDGRSAAADASRGQAELDWVRQIAFDGASVPPLELAAALELIAYFDGVVCTRQERAGFGDNGPRAKAPTWSGSPISAQQVAIPGASGDPFEILKIPTTATDDEVRAAYKRAMKLNHPDKVSHMSAEIQAYAHAQVRAIKAAYDAILSVRGK